MLDIPDIIAVREAVERQRGFRRRICEMIMEDYERWEICRELGISRFTLRRHLLAVRESFCEMGFDEWLLPRTAARRRRRRQVQTHGRPMAILNVSWRRV